MQESLSVVQMNMLYCRLIYNMASTDETNYRANPVYKNYNYETFWNDMNG